MYSWTLVAVLISSLAPLSKQGDPPVKCDDYEVLLTTPRKDKFCKPELTIAAELHKPRKCVCETGYVRNAWSHCIRVQDCEKCKKWPNADYHGCETRCPLTCGKPVPTGCVKVCVGRCACPPGYVRGSSGKFECVSIKECPPTCQPNSTFEICKYGCEPRCFKPPPKDTCVPRCHTAFHSLFACNVVDNVRSEDITEVTTHVIPSVYVTYIGVSGLLFSGLLMSVLKKLVELALNTSRKYMLYTLFQLFFLVFTALTGIVNCALAFLYSSSYLKLIRACTVIEERIPMLPKEHTAAVRYAYKMIAWQIFASSWSLYFNTAGGLDIIELPEQAKSSGFLQSLIQALKCHSILLSSVWSMIPCFWMAYFARTFRCYVRAISHQLDACLRSSDISPERKSRQVDTLRQELERVKAASGIASRIVSPGFTAKLYLNMVNLSIAVHCASTGTMLTTRVRTFFTGWVIIQIVSLAWPVLAWQRISNEVARLRYNAQNFQLLHSAPTILSEHVLMFLHSAENGCFKNAFGGFIAIRPSLVATVLAAVAAYTVLLRQTTGVFTSSVKPECAP
ncbi:hypothetical protein MTO96_012352 [Rhipicephalus appendiculatus]